jgi:hypothetical protein
MRRRLFRLKSEKEEKVLDGVDGSGKSAYSDEAWEPLELLYEPPLLEVTQSQGSFCTIRTRFAAALQPDALFDLLADPNNRSVFKGIKISFVLAKQGGMTRKFTGLWKIEPMKASEAETMEALHTDTGVVKTSQTGSGRGTAADDPIVGSWVTFEQETDPTIKPPWPLSNYIRGIAEKVVRDMVADLQRECQRISELPKTSSSSTSEIPTATPETDVTPKVDTDGHDLKGSTTV